MFYILHFFATFPRIVKKREFNICIGCFANHSWQIQYIIAIFAKVFPTIVV